MISALTSALHVHKGITFRLSLTVVVKNRPSRNNGTNRILHATEQVYKAIARLQYVIIVKKKSQKE